MKSRRRGARLGGLEERSRPTSHSAGARHSLQIDFDPNDSRGSVRSHVAR